MELSVIGDPWVGATKFDGGQPHENGRQTTGEKDNIDQIVATLGLKEMTQGALIRKLCTWRSNTQPNSTRRVIFENP